MRTRFLFITFALSLTAAACADDMAPGLEGEDDIDSDVADVEGLKADGLGSTATYYNIKRDTRKCAAPMCGGYFVNRVNRDWTKCHDGVWRNACYVAGVDFERTLGLAADEASTLDGDIFRGAIVVRGSVKADKFNGQTFGRFVPSEAWRAATDTAAKGTFYRLTDRGVACITGPCPILHQAMLNSTTSSNIHGLKLDAAGVNEIQVNQVWTELDAGPVLAVGKNVTYKDELTGRPGVRLEATQVYSRVTHAELSSYAPTAREIAGRDFASPGVAPAYPRTYRFDYSTWNVRIEDAVAPCPAGAVCIWSGIVTQTATWSVSGDVIRLAFTSDLTNGYGLQYVKELFVKHDAAGNLVLVETVASGTNRQFR